MAASKLIVLNCVIKKEDKGFSGHCLELDVCSQGKTVEDTNSNLLEAVKLYLDSIEELGITKQVFKERNIRVYSKKPKTQNIPVEVLAEDNHDLFVTTRAIPCC